MRSLIVLVGLEVYMKKLYELRDNLCDQLNDYAGTELSTGSLEIIDKLTHSIKNLDKIIDKEEGNEYSNNYGGSYGMHYPRVIYDGSYNNMGGSYARGRGRNARRDSMGRYASENGYSRHGDVTQELYELMENAPDDRTRQLIQNTINQMGQ